MIFAASTPWWQDPVFIIPTLIAIIAIIFGIWGVYRQIGKKELSYEIVSDTPIISVEKSLANRVKIELDGKVVKEVSSVVIKVWNSGNKEITKADYDVDDPLQFHFEGRVVISSEDVEAKPEHIIKSQLRKTFIFQPAPDAVEFTPLLLNPKKGKESITFSVLLSGRKGEITSTGRIAGGDIKKGELSRGKSLFDLSFFHIGMIFYIFFIVYMLTIYIASNIKTSSGDLIIFISTVMLLLSIIALLLLLIRRVKHKHYW